MGALFEKPAFLILILIVLLLFGAKRLPDLARGLGRSARILKSETDGLRTDETPAAPPVRPRAGVWKTRPRPPRLDPRITG